MNITESIVQATNERVFHYFREISKIPRGSNNEQAIADYLVAFAKERGLEVRRCDTPVDDHTAHDVVICKPGTPGFDGLDTLILQSHIDMVCQKVPGSAHDFTKDPIKLVEKDGKMTADGTTLGADDGIGVACMLAILESNDIAHPPIEALFTSDEEDGMAGAIAVTADLVKGNRLINIDTETEGVMYYGCAGGVDAIFRLPIRHEPVPANAAFLHIELSGLLGGHSGVEIHKKHANAHILMARTLRAIQDECPMRLVTFTGGDKRNVITRSAGALIGVDTADVQKVIDLVAKQEEIFRHEYDGIEMTQEGASAIVLAAKTSAEKPAAALAQDSTDTFLRMVMVMPNGVQAMHGKVEGLVETSCNLGIITQKEDHIYLCSLIRSFFRSKKLYVLDQMRQLALLAGAGFTAASDYPDWEPNLSSELMARFGRAYTSAFPGKEAEFMSIHAGLECGYFTQKFPQMDMIACGPTITGAHTPEETLYIDSTEKVVKLLLTVLAQMDEAPPAQQDMLCAANVPGLEHEHEHICQCIR